MSYSSCYLRTTEVSDIFDTFYINHTIKLKMIPLSDSRNLQIDVIFAIRVHLSEMDYIV